MSTRKNDIPTEAITRSTSQMSEATGNIYETIVMISKRANQIAEERQRELRKNMEEKKPLIDNLEETQINNELIELSRCFEKKPKPTLVATYEYEQNEIYHKTAEVKKEI